MNNLNKRNVFEHGMEIFAWLDGEIFSWSRGELSEDRRSRIATSFQELQKIVNLADDYVREDDAKRCLRFCEDDLGNGS